MSFVLKLIPLKLFAIFLLWLSVLSLPAQPHPEPDVKFTDLDNQKIQRCFLEVLKKYDDLNDQKFIVVQKKIAGSTMQAQPIIKLSRLFSNKRKYKVKVATYVRDSENIRVADLPEEVLKGWFAHELGHVVDYEPFSNFQMIGFGLKYLFSSEYKRKVEYSADYRAIERGFTEEILASKRFILEQDLVSEKYIEKISKFYLPIKIVELCLEDDSFIPVNSSL